MKQGLFALTVIAVLGLGCAHMDKIIGSHRDGEGLRHIVMFRFNEGAPPEEIRAIEKALAELPQKITAIQAFEWGDEVSGRGLNQGFTHCAYMVFKDEAARQTYIEHPVHKDFAALASPSVDQIFVFDYWPKQ